MIQLYRKRDFSTYISDTIAFFRDCWKNFFTNYLVITGGILALLCVMYFFVFRDLFASVFSTANSGVTEDISSYFTDSPVSFLLMVMGMSVLSVFFTVFSASYSLAYLKLTEETGRMEFTASEIFQRMKIYLPRAIRFTLLSFVTFIPIIIGAAMLSSVLILLVVGFFALLLLIPVASVWIMQTFYVYLLTDVHFISAMKQGWKILFSKKFWHIIGSTAVVYLILSVMQGIVTVIPYMIVMFSTLTTGAGAMYSGMAIILSVIYIVSIILSYITSNILIVNQGVIYYSSLEQTTHVQALSEIDLIGQNVE